MIVSLLVSSSEICTAPERPNCDVLQCRWIFHCPAWRRAKRQHRLHSHRGLSCLGSLQSKRMIIIPSLFITTMYRIFTGWQFHIRRNSWPHHNVEIDLACCDFLSLLKPSVIFISDGRENMMCWIFALFNYIWCCGVRFDSAQSAQAAGPMYDKKQWNKEIL